MAGLVQDWRIPSARNPDDWLERASAVSRPICAELRDCFFRWEPDLTESIKWNSLCFSGRKLVCGLGAFKRHVGVSFFRGTELSDPAGIFDPGGENNAAVRTVRVTSLERQNRDALRRILRAAVALDAEPALPPPPRPPREPLPLPDFFAAALRVNRAAAAGFTRLAPTYQREFIAWLQAAKRPETQARRLEETLLTLAAGRKWAQRHDAG